MSIYVAIKASAKEGKWQVSRCRSPFSSVLLCDDSDRNMAKVNKARLGQSGLCGSSSQSPTPLGLHNGTGIAQQPDKDVLPVRAAFCFTGAEMICLCEPTQ